MSSGAQGQNQGSGGNYSAAERSQRSVFVGNIPYEATEEELKELFSQVGAVVGFRLVLDRETGKPKGYGFCEYSDQETALSALRNLNGYEFHGRNLRVDTAAGDRSKEELRQLQMTFGAPQEESPYGQPVDPSKAPESITRAVASLPPEQMFELMKQMKLCIQNNPNEARNLLLQNPQLAYALLQAQVVMRLVDPQTAIAMLHREPQHPLQAPLLPPGMQPGGPAAIPPGPAAIPTMQPTTSITGLPAASIPVGGVTVPDIDYRNAFGAPSMGGFPMHMGTQPAIPYPPTASMQPAIGLPAAANPMPPMAGSSEDQEKAALIVQVMQLTEEQIAMLPVDQRQSVLLLREKLRGGQR